ncbi:MAG TPA: glycosyltransferase family 39 protein [Planctomycetota bacterium]|jgi:hypothetical protein|nr:glycosyltransferase family 39 protein [Planctomycetota bacterium]OQC22387.1 MAG: Undecaprenyl phosphate-alpha-4-amino-4-deoxy-L-arabinose arabinosyl transferase [Planctomycetes bacterium ADurb.Bin069]HNR98850.1 glycosyltransferase family 39 protein [Planctomycetota bacterium]HNU26665.1 glycosyltransferase family 39 protein [Planctomycetota bacterium]HOE29164.1 glycosyltransferase family 39 protein [Planctomycetota bacterium]
MPTETSRPAAAGNLRSAALVLALCAVLFVPGFFVRGLWSPDEPRYAAVAWQMAHSGEFLIPKINDEYYNQKPPLFFYLAAAGHLLVPAAGGRIVEAAALAAFALLLAAFFDPRERTAARLAPFIALTALLSFESGKFGVTDGALMFFLTLGVLLGRRALASERPLRAWCGCMLAVALGTLVKGPQIVPFAALALAASLADVERKAPARAHLAGLAAGTLLYLGLVGAWVVPACIAGGESYRAELLGQLWGRVTGARQSHNHPWHYYLAQAPAGFLPWTLIFAAAAVQAFRRPRPNLWLLCWAVGGFVLLSGFAGKRMRYLTMILPACALLAARYAAASDPDRLRKLAIRATAAALAAAGLALAATGAVLSNFDAVLRAIETVVRVFRPAYSAELPLGAAEVLAGFSRFGAWVLAPLLGLAVLAGARVAWRAATGAAAVRGIVLSCVAFSLAFDLVFTPALDPVKSAAEFMARTAEWSARGADIALYQNDFDGLFNMRLSRERLAVHPTREAAAQALASPAPTAIVFLCRRPSEEASFRSLQGAVLLAEGLKSNHRVLLIGNQAAAALAPEALPPPAAPPK